MGATHFMVIRTGSDAAYIKVYALEPSETPPSGAVSVEEALLFFGKRNVPGTS
jgi:hypothetical protein